jgi:hypothetical protein
MEVLIFFEKNKILGVEANRVLNILEEIKKALTIMNILEFYQQTYTYDTGNNLTNLSHQANSVRCLVRVGSFFGFVFAG